MLLQIIIKKKQMYNNLVINLNQSHLKANNKENNSLSSLNKIKN
jgi:hypothetical protein